MQRYEALLKVLETGSFTSAAQILGYSQSAVSKMISSLEEELQIRLILRSRYGIRLTPEGEKMLPFIRSTVGQYHSMQLAADGLREAAAGEVRIGAFASITQDWLIHLIGSFWKSYPGIHFDVRSAGYSKIADMVSSGQLDVGFVNAGAAAGLDRTFLKKDNFLLVVPNDHPLAEKEHLCLEDLQSERFLMVNYENEAYNEVISAFSSAGVWPDIVLYAHSDAAILAMVEAGYGISILSERIVHSGGRNVTARNFDIPIQREIYIVTRAQELVPAAAKRFAAYAVDHVNEL